MPALGHRFANARRAVAPVVHRNHDAQPYDRVIVHGPQLRRVIRINGLLILSSILVLAAVVANVSPNLVDFLFSIVGLRAFGPAVVTLLTRLTEGLLILLILAVYIERRPFRQVDEHLIELQYGLRSAFDRRFSDLRETLEGIEDGLKGTQSFERQVLISVRNDIQHLRVHQRDIPGIESNPLDSQSSDAAGTGIQAGSHMSVYRQIAAEYAHTIRTPLAAVDLALSSFRRAVINEALPPEEVGLRQSHLRQTVDDASFAIDSIRSILSSGAGFLDDSPAEFSPHRLALKAVAMTREATGSTAKVAVDLQDLSFIRFYRAKLLIALLQLLENAFEAVGPDATITITGSRDPATRTVSLRVTDTGPLIPVSAQPHLFDLGYSTKPSHTGIGLPLARQSLEAVGGSIRLLSTTSVETVFEISFVEVDLSGP